MHLGRTLSSQCSHTCCCCCCCCCCSLKAKPEGPNAPGQDIEVTARVTPNLASISGAMLLYRINFSPEQQLIMRTDGKTGERGMLVRRAYTCCGVLRSQHSSS
jgi:hypothetical protein